MIRELVLTVSITSGMLVSGVSLAQPPRNPPPARPGAGGTVAGPQPGAGKYLAIPGLFPLSMSGVQRRDWSDFRPETAIEGRLGRLYDDGSAARQNV